MTTMMRNNYPVAVRVAQILEGRIASGDYEAGAWLPTERALATEFKVDRSQIRAALDRLEHKSLITRIPGHRPVVSGHRRQAVIGGEPTVRRPIVTIAAIVPQHPYYPAAAAILKGIQQALRQSEERGRLLVFDTHSPVLENMLDLEHQALTALEEDDIAGGILWPTLANNTSTRPRVRDLEAKGHPIVYVDRCPESESCDFVGVDNRFAATEAMEYLLRLGHRRIGFLTNTDPAIPVTERAVGYREALRNAGIPYDPNLVLAYPIGHALDGIASVAHFFSLPKPPTAVFAMNDSLGHALIQGMDARGLSVPDDLSIIGFDDLERFSPRAALLTTMHQPFQRIGQRAAELLLERLADRRTHDESETPFNDEHSTSTGRQVLLPTPMVERVTCAPPRSKAE